MSKKIITIGRTYGSGGRLIGREVANKLGYAFYDKEDVEHYLTLLSDIDRYFCSLGEETCPEKLCGIAQTE